ncbi:MAG: right-handed parallel beta-helix repeat-containing protein [Planctomycetota bacterium]|nr:right-handed parallel beta-helix repeat-containing protein [Planctomycetota bacterium]
MKNAVKIIMVILLLSVVITGCNKEWEQTTGVESGSSGEVGQEDFQPVSTTAIGTIFLPTNPAFPNIRLETSQPIQLIADIGTKTVSFLISPISTTQGSETIITISGLEQFWTEGATPITLFRHENGSFIEEFTVDSEGRYTWTQQLDTEKAVHVYILPVKGTVDIGREANNEPPPAFRPYTYDSSTRTYTLTQDLNESINIVANNITLDGNYHDISGSGDGYGVYLNNRSGVTVKNCSIRKFYEGIFLYYSNNNIITDNVSRENLNHGIYLYRSSTNTISSNITELNIGGYRGYGIHIYWYSNGNTITDNAASFNGAGQTVQKVHQKILFRQVEKCCHESLDI